MNSIADIRKDYRRSALLEADLAADPFAQFTRWWEEAIHSEVDEVNAMTLATAAPDGQPTARIVLLKGFDTKGFVFYTNYNSEKGRTMAANPKVALVFFWKELERQVRIEGTVSKTSEADSDAYFNSRPAASRIGACISPQSAIIPDRATLEKKFTELEAKFGDGNIPRPEHWGGYIVSPTLFEFWQGRSNRLHDRLQYAKRDDGWKIERLAP